MPSEPIIELIEANIFQKDHLVLSNVNLNINAGDFVFLIGKVGSGKTSLIRTFNAQISLKSGFGQVAGFDLTKLKSRQIPKLRRKIGVIFQDFQLLDDRNVHDNLEFVLKATGWSNKKDIEDRILQVLTKVELEYKGYKMPHQLSGGERQRVAIARAMLNEPEIILADEPTGNLDPDTSMDIFNLLRDIASSGRTVIMATHNYTLLKKFNYRTLKCENGKLTEINQGEEIDFSNLM